MKYVVKVQVQLLVEATVTVAGTDSPEEAQKIAKEKAEAAVVVSNHDDNSVVLRVENIGTTNVEVDEAGPDWENL